MNGPGEILREAARLVSEERAKTYGPYWISLGRIARLWSAYKEVEISACDVAVMLALMKLSRTRDAEGHRDNYVDAAGYVAIAGALEERGPGREP